MSDLTTSLVTSELASGIARNTSPERQAQRAEAKTYIEQQNQKLNRLKATEPTQEQFAMENDIVKQELLKTREQNRMLIGNVVKQRTFDAFDRFSADYDPKHLTTMIQDLKTQGLPTGPLGQVARVDKLSELDKPILEQLGWNADAILNSPEALATLVRVTGVDGNTSIRSMDRLKGVTGYSRYATNRELEEQRKRTEILALLRKGQGGAGTKDEREAARLVAEKYPELEQGSEEFQARFNDEYETIIRRNRQTAAGKEEDAVDQVVTNIDKLAQEKFRQDFFDLPMSDPKNRRVFEREIERMERLGKLDLSESEKKKMSQIKQLIAIGNPAASISDKETGMIDRFSNDMQKFVRDKVDGVAATSAYAAYRNILRNALYGSVLTEGEMKAFKDQFGDLGQQTGPILVQFKTALTQLRGDMQSLLDTNNSYVMHFRMGKDREELQNIIDSLQERIDFLGSAEFLDVDVIPKARENTKQLSDDVRTQLDAIANEVSQ